MSGVGFKLVVLALCGMGSPVDAAPPKETQAEGSKAVSPAVRRQLQSEEATCITGYAMDLFCLFNTGWLLDMGPDFPTLENADIHTVHCLVDVDACFLSGFAMLYDPPPGGPKKWSVAYQLDEAGNAAVIDLARATGLPGAGACTSCQGGGTLERGFRATVVGKPNYSTDPPTLDTSINGGGVYDVDTSCEDLLGCRACTPAARELLFGATPCC